MNTDTAMITKQPALWILAADNTHARLYVYSKFPPKVTSSKSGKRRLSENVPEEALTPLPDVTVITERLPQDSEADDQAFYAAHASAEESSAEHKLKYMQTITLKLKHAYSRRYFRKLVIVAHPQALGDLREHLDPAIRQCIMAELPKERPHCAPHELLAHVRPALDEATFRPRMSLYP